MKWDSNVHEDILVAISDVLQLSRADWEHIMSALHNMGYAFTEGALKYVIYILEGYASCLRIFRSFFFSFFSLAILLPPLPYHTSLWLLL